MGSVASSFFWTARRMTGREFIRAKASSQTSLLPMSYWVPTGVRRNSFWKGSDLSGRKGALELPCTHPGCLPLSAKQSGLFLPCGSPKLQPRPKTGWFSVEEAGDDRSGGANPRARGAHVYTRIYEFRSNFSPIQEGDCATFSAVSDTRCSTYLIFTAFLTAECSTVELPGNIPILC